MNKKLYINILLFITIITLSIHSYSIGENTAPAHDNSSIIQQKIAEEFKNLCNKIISLNEIITNFTSPEIKDEFNNKIQAKTKPIIATLDASKPLAYSKILGFFNMPEHASASKYPLYNASKIPLTNNFCIAAEGPCDTTCENFFALLGETKAKISISLVSKSELVADNNKRLCRYLESDRSKLIIDEVKSMRKPNEIMCDKHTIQIIDRGTNNEASLEYEILLINGKHHVRIYNTNWQDDETTDPNRLAHIIFFAKKVKSLLDMLEGKTESPTFVVNCNAGVGRAGTFISIYELIENYLNNQKIVDITAFIVNARKYRSHFVYNVRQFGMIKHFMHMLPEYINSL